MSSMAEDFDRAVRTWASVCETSRRGRVLARDCAWLIRSSRLLLDYPRLPHICGASDARETLRQRVRDALTAGTLPPMNGTRSWAGRGTGRTCRICHEPVGPDQIEHEVEAPDSVFVHQACMILWREESERIRVR